MPKDVPVHCTLADKLRQLKELHALKKTPPDIAEAQLQGFWWFMCLCAGEMNAGLDYPEDWAATLAHWNKEAQANFEKQYAHPHPPWLPGTNPRSN